MSVSFHIRKADQPTVLLRPQYSTAPPDGGEWSVSLPLLYPMGKKSAIHRTGQCKGPTVSLGAPFFLYTGLLKMIVRVLTTCHTQYT